MNRPTVSIVIPTYRSAAYLSRAIASVTAQTCEDWELIIVDGESDDGTADVAAGWSRRLPGRIEFIVQENRGCCFARNTGIDAARGRFVAMLDSDDEFAPNKLERQIRLFDRCPELGLVYSDYAFVDLDGSRHESVFAELQPIALRAPYVEIEPGLRLCGGDLFEWLIQGYFISTIVGLVRREVLGRDVRFLVDQPYNHEWVYFLDIVRRCRAGYVNEPLSVHHFVDGSLTRRSSLANMEAARRMFRVMIERYGRESRFARRSLARQAARNCDDLAAHHRRRGAMNAALQCQFDAAMHRPGLRSFGRIALGGIAWLAGRGAAHVAAGARTA